MLIKCSILSSHYWQIIMKFHWFITLKLAAVCKSDNMTNIPFGKHNTSSTLFQRSFKWLLFHNGLNSRIVHFVSKGTWITTMPWRNQAPLHRFQYPLVIRHQFLIFFWDDLTCRHKYRAKSNEETNHLTLIGKFPWAWHLETSPKNKKILQNYRWLAWFRFGRGLFGQN